MKHNFGRDVRRVLAAQVVLMLAVVAVVLAATAATSGGAFAALGLARAKSAAFGAALGMLATLLTARSVLQSADAAKGGLAGFAMLPMFAGLLLKLFVVAGGAYFALAWLQLPPFFLLLGYITMQAGYVWSGSGGES